MTNFLVTGYAGFIGSHLCDYLLAAGHRVVGIDNFDPFYDRAAKLRNTANLPGHPRFTGFEADLRDPLALSRLDAQIGPVDAVVHLAARAGVGPSVADPAGYVLANVLGTTHLLEWLRQRGIWQLLFASSSSVYGNSPVQPFREDQPLLGSCISPYAASKLAAEHLTHTYHHLYGLSVLNARFFTVYGPRQRPDLAIHKFTRLLKAGQPVPVFGDGRTARDYTFVADTVDGIARGLAWLARQPAPVYETVNLGNHRPIALLDLVNALGTALHVQPQLDFQPAQPGDVQLTFADISKAQQLLGYAPKTSLAEGLRQWVQWYSEMVK